MFGQPLQARAQVDRIPDDRVAAPDVRAHIAHAHDARIEPNAHSDLGQAALSMIGVDLPNGLRHFQGRSHRQLRVVWCSHRSPPKRHDAVAHVFVDGAAVAADDMGELAEHFIQQPLQLQRLHPLRHGGEAAHVAEHHRQLPVGGLHAVVLRLLDHFGHQFWRHIGAEQRCEFALGPALHKITVGHVEREGQHGHHHRRSQRQRQALGDVHPQVQPHQRRNHASAQQDR